MRLGLFFIFISNIAFASFIKAETSYYDSISLRIFLSNTIVKEKINNPEINLNLGVCQEKDDMGILTGFFFKRSLFQYEACFSPSYIFMEDDDIFLLDFLLQDPKTPKISLLYSLYLKALKDKNLFFIGAGFSYELSSSLTGALSFQFGASPRFAVEVIFK